MAKYIQSIPTFYKHIKFRSRLEVRWAVFFDCLKIKYEYEKQHYVMPDGNWYLPDFEIEQKYLAEVKPLAFTKEQLYKVSNLPMECFMLSRKPTIKNVLGAKTRFGKKYLKGKFSEFVYCFGNYDEIFDVCEFASGVKLDGSNIELCEQVNRSGKNRLSSELFNFLYFTHEYVPFYFR